MQGRDLHGFPYVEAHGRRPDLSDELIAGCGSRITRLLWDFDPNGLLVLDDTLRVIQVNAALCQMLKSERKDLLGRKAADLLGEVSDFQRAYTEQCEVTGEGTSYPRYELYVR